jgi:holo-[acyl-carrier protein] synthase
MVFGIGIDIIEIDRIKNSIDRLGDSFLNKVFTKNEIAYCKSKANIYQHFAVRFAAKEAVAKALSTGWNKEFSWKDVEIVNQLNGMPEVHLKGNLKNLLEDEFELKISMSHSRDYAVCNAIIFQTKKLT